MRRFDKLCTLLIPLADLCRYGRKNLDFVAISADLIGKKDHWITSVSLALVHSFTKAGPSRGIAIPGKLLRASQTTDQLAAVDLYRTLAQVRFFYIIPLLPQNPNFFMSYDAKIV